MKLATAVALLSAACIWAQETSPETVPDMATAPQSTTDTSTESDYGGPSVLTRAGSASIGNALAHVSLTPFVTLTGIYDSGLANTVVNSQGRVPYVDAFGVQAAFGVTGARRWKRSLLQLGYRGSLRHYSQESYYDGMDNSLSLAFTHQLSARTSFVLTNSATRYQRGYGLPLSEYYNSGPGSYDPTYPGLTTNDLYDTPTTALSTGGTLIHQWTPRISTSAGVSGFFVRRRSEALIGTNGYSGQGDVAYRITRYQTLSVGYTFSHFGYQNGLGQSDMHGISLAYSVRLGRHMELALIAGGFRVESLRVRRIMFDPVIAALLGQQYGLQEFYSVSYTPRIGAHITRTFKNASVNAGYDRTVQAGNGLYATSAYETLRGGYNYMGIRRVNIQAGASYQRYSAMTQSLGRYRNYSAGGGATYYLSRGISLLLRADVRRYSITNSVLERTNGRFQFGFAWSPGEYPLALW